MFVVHGQIKVGKLGQFFACQKFQGQQQVLKEGVMMTHAFKIKISVSNYKIRAKNLYKVRQETCAISPWLLTKVVPI